MVQVSEAHLDRCWGTRLGARDGTCNPSLSMARTPPCSQHLAQNMSHVRSRTPPWCMSRRMKNVSARICHCRIACGCVWLPASARVCMCLNVLSCVWLCLVMCMPQCVLCPTVSRCVTRPAPATMCSRCGAWNAKILNGMHGTRETQQT